MGFEEREFLKRLTAVRPTARQLSWQQLEFTAFIHFGMNTFTDKEWGDGTADVSLFAPQALDTDQWCACLKAAGIRGCILTAKHHDGFCLWDTKTTDYSVMHSPCKTDVVRLLAESCARYGLRFGIYVSPWDRHEAAYGQGKAYDDYFSNQLEELLTGYGPLYTVWFDGACGEGPDGKKQKYDWKRYYGLIRRLQPEAVISVCGPDVRWCGNEAGHCRPSEWSVVPASLFSQERIAEHSQKEDSEEFRNRPAEASDEDLGSREVMRREKRYIWYPAEVDTSIRPGWFYHDNEEPKPLEELVRIYCNAVGGNSGLLLNIPPDRNGRIDRKDEARLKELGDWIRAAFETDLGERAERRERKPGEPDESGGEDKPGEQSEMYVWELSWPEPVRIGWVVLQEAIENSQRIESFVIEAADGAAGENDGFRPVFHGTVVGHKRICRLPEAVDTACLRVRVTECRLSAELKGIQVYQP